MIFSPTFGLIVLAIGFIVKLRDIVGSTKMLVSRHFLVDWSHKKRLSDDTQFYLSDKKRKKFEKKAIKEYNKHIDEFIGFDILSDVFRKG
jgi:hypothetical protein